MTHHSSSIFSRTGVSLVKYGNSAYDCDMEVGGDVTEARFGEQLQMLRDAGRLYIRERSTATRTARGDEWRSYYVRVAGALRPLYFRRGHEVVPGVWSGPLGGLVAPADEAIPLTGDPRIGGGWETDVVYRSKR